MKVKKNVKIAIISLVVLIAVLSIAVFVILKIKKSNTTRGFMDPYNDNTSAEDLVPIQIDKKGDLKNRAKDNTVMIYMVGSNLESQGRMGSVDILEMSFTVVIFINIISKILFK